MRSARGIEWVAARAARTTYLVAVLCVLLALVPTRLHRVDGLHAVNLLCAALTAVPVLLVPRNLAVAWSSSVVLVLVLPRAYGARTGPELTWGWSWTVGFTLAVGYVLYRVALRYRLRVVVPAAAITFAATWPRLADWGDAAVPGFLVGGAVVLGYAVRQRRESEELRRAERTRAVAAEERTRIARELHDVVSHHMSALVLRTDAVAYRLPDLAPEVRAELDVIQGMARDGLTEMRRMLVVLRADDGAEGAPQPGLADVEEMVARLRATGAEITLTAEVGAVPVPAGVGLSAYRIVQEALSNSGRHAPGGAADVGIAVDAGVLRIGVRNAAATRRVVDGDPARVRHGLVGMAERVRVLGGAFTAGPTPDGGFSVVAELRLEEGDGS